VAYQMAPKPVTLSDLERHFCCETFLYPIPLEICLQLNWKVHVICNFNHLFKTEAHLWVASSHVHCNCGNILETVRDNRPLIESDLSYQTAAIAMTLSNLQGHSPNASLFKCDFSCSFAAVDKISTDVARWQPWWWRVQVWYYGREVPHMLLLGFT